MKAQKCCMCNKAPKNECLYEFEGGIYCTICLITALAETGKIYLKWRNDEDVCEVTL